MFDVPILFMNYNRPVLTRIVFEEIRKLKPRKLFITCDGPKEGVLGDIERCLSVRKALQGKVDWDCELLTLYQSKNLGGKWGGYTALNWFFNNVEEGIILEDDDLFDQSFPYFCKELLEKYRNDERIGTISGDNFQFGNNVTEDSYYFSKYMHGWGWATWRRTWKLLDIEMKDWPEIKSFFDCVYPYTMFETEAEKIFWRNTWDRMYAGANDAWDYQLYYYLWKNQMLNIIPNINLVTNIGADGTHGGNNRMINQPRKKMSFPLKHPKEIKRFVQADIYTLRYYL